MKKKLSILFVVVGLVFLFSLIYKYHVKDLNNIPLKIHSWVQCEYISIADKFSKEETNFFTPRTYLFNKLYSNDNQGEELSNITRIDFPIHSYIAGMFMRLSGSESPFIYRFLTLLMSMVGLFYLFKLVRLFTEDIIVSIFLIALFLFSPVYFYYLSGTLSTPYALSLAIIGLYFYLKYLKEDKRKNIILSIVFLVLAALIRTSTAVFLIATFSHRILFYFKNKQIHYREVFVYLLGFVLFIGYLLYNIALEEKYGSMFLGNLRMAKSWEEAKKVLTHIYTYNKYIYFTIYHYWLFGAALLFTPIILFSKNIKRINKDLVLLGLVSLFGSILIFILMMTQYTAHDYYFLDIFVIPLFLILIGVLTSIRIKAFKYQVVVFVVASVLMFFSYRGFGSIIYYRTSDLPYYNCLNYKKKIEDFENIKAKYDIKDSDKIFSIFPPAPSLANVITKHDGYFLFGYLWKEFQYLKDKSYGLGIIENSRFPELIKYYSSILSYIKIRYSNDEVLYFQKADNIEDNTLVDCLSEAAINTFHSEITSDTICSNWDKKLKILDTNINDSVFILNSDEHYSCVFNKIFDIDSIPSKVLVNFRLNAKEKVTNLKYAVVFEQDGEESVFLYKNITNSIIYDKYYRNYLEFFDKPKFHNSDKPVRVYIYMMNEGSEIHYTNGQVMFFDWKNI
ncbi:MAG: hypothetical protein ACEPOV_05795 [Hyphomicrobiales bacterium]